MTRGVDIYRYQTVTDYGALARAVGFVWVKLTDGNGPAQVRGDGQVNGCRRAGIPVGGYHYAQKGDPITQCRAFVRELRRLDALDIAPALDMEAPFAPNDEARRFAITFLRELVNYGYRPAIYMSASWAGALQPDQWGIPGLVIWIAAYGANNGANYDSQADPSKVRRYYRGRYDVHQHASTAVVSGIRGKVDLNWALTGVPRNATKQEDDMQLNDKVNWDEINKLGPNTPGHKILSTWQNSLAARSFAEQTLALVAADKDVDADALATAVVAKQRELLEEIIREVVPDEVAADVVARLGERLRGVAEPPVS